MMSHAQRTAQVVKFKTSLLNSGLCDYSDAYVPVEETISVAVVLIV